MKANLRRRFGVLGEDVDVLRAPVFELTSEHVRVVLMNELVARVASPTWCRARSSFSRTLSETVELRTQLPANRANDVVGQRAQARYEATTQQLEILAQDHARGFIARSEWLAMRPPLLEQVAPSKVVLDTDHIEAVLGDFVGRSAQLAGSWSNLDGNRRRAVITALVEKVIVLPAPRAACPASSRVVIWWRGERKPRISARRVGGLPALRKAGAFDRCAVTGCKGRYLRLVSVPSLPTWVPIG